MMSVTLVKGLICFYVVIAVVSLLEKKYPWTLYWVCAAGISLAVLWMRGWK